SKRPFAGPEAVLAYLSLYTHRIAISNRRLVTFDDTSVTFRWKDYRANGRDRVKVMTLAIDEFIRRFLIHVLPGGFHRIRHYGLFANGGRADNIAQARQLLDVKAADAEPADTPAPAPPPPPPPPPPHPKRLRIRALAAGAACSSSRPAIADARRGIVPGSRPGSTAHERQPPFTTPKRPPTAIRYRAEKRGARPNGQIVVSDRAPRHP